jgi:serine/threonine-protein kinase
MKVLRQEDMPETQLEALFSEPCLLFELDHPHIIRVFDAGLLAPQYGGRGYFIMEYVAGGSLRNYLRGKPCLPLTEALTLARQICDGMALAHRQQPPIIHRDLKPENILIRHGEDGLCAKIGDFGLAQSVNAMTRWTLAAGTLDYKPPEALYNVDSAAGDVFAIGMILYEMLTGLLPFPLESRGNNELERRQNLLVTAREQPPQAPSQVNLAVDDELDRIVLKALAFNPTDRYPSSVEFLAALRHYEQQLQEMPISESGSVPAAAASSATRSQPVPEAHRYVDQALEYARQAATLPQAIEYLEKAMILDASLRPRYAKRLGQWKMGIVL